MLGQRHDQATAQRIENQSIGHSVNQAACHRANARECLQAIAGDGQRQRQRTPYTTMAEVQKLFDIEITRCCVVQLTEFLRHCGAYVALYQHIGTRTHSRKCPNHCLTRPVANDLL